MEQTQKPSLSRTLPPASSSPVLARGATLAPSVVLLAFVAGLLVQGFGADQAALLRACMLDGLEGAAQLGASFLNAVSDPNSLMRALGASALLDLTLPGGWA